MPETNGPSADDMISRGEVFETVFGSKSPDEDGHFERNDRDKAVGRMTELFGGHTPEHIVMPTEEVTDQSGTIANLF